MYSPDRKQYLEKQISYLQKMDGYTECQKILVVDGLANIRPDGFEIAEMDRGTGQFNWSRAWKTGVERSKFQNILYLDSDRIFPKHYLSEVKRALHDDPECFVYTPNLFTIQQYPGTDVIDELLSLNPEDIKKKRYKGIVFEPRFTKPVHFPGKNAMSGSVAFSKDTYRLSGGVDPWYEGHGAFADSDFFMQTVRKNFRFFVLPNIPELHFGHTKRDGNNNIVSDKELRLEGLHNFIYYCSKWGIGFDKPLIVAKNIGVPSPEEYIAKIIEEQKR